VYEERGVSQVLFGFLPEQTVDLRGGIWIVEEWLSPVPISVRSVEALARELRRAIAPWAKRGNDHGVHEQLLTRALDIEVVEPSPTMGVRVKPFPRLWRCNACGRVHRKKGSCRCGAGQSELRQLPFVCYHSCGFLREPSIPKCKAHEDVAMTLPHTTRISEVEFHCPTCQRPLGTGLRRRCECNAGELASVNVHRAGDVFSPHYAVVLNPHGAASEDRGASTVSWALEGGMGHARSAAVADLVETLRRSGLSEDTVRTMIEAARRTGELREEPGDIRVLRLLDGLREPARKELMEQSATMHGLVETGRTTVADLEAAAEPPRQIVYQTYYRDAMESAGLRRDAGVQLLTKLPVLTAAFGYTRDEDEIGSAQLKVYRSPAARRPTIRLYGLQRSTEALVFWLDPVRVFHWLVRRGLMPSTPEPVSHRDAHELILASARIPAWPGDDCDGGGRVLATLVHSYCHRAMRRLSPIAGVERESLAEYLFPHLLAFAIYAAPRGEFVLGGLQAVFETSLHEFLRELVHGERRCPLDPACRSQTGACMACLHLGEPSCRWYNTLLDRSVLFGPEGYLG
jgi:hypothetical protein